MKRPVQVTVLNQQYAIRSDAPVAEVQEVARFVNEQIEQIQRSNRSVDTMNTVVLALLNVAGQYLQVRRKCGELEESGTQQERELERILHRMRLELDGE